MLLSAYQPAFCRPVVIRNLGITGSAYYLIQLMPNASSRDAAQERYVQAQT